MLKTKKEIKRVAFFGDAMAKSKDQHYIDAFYTAKLLAQNGYIIVNGGGPGVMEASSAGAKSVDGKVEVVIIDPKLEPGNYEGSSELNLKMADKRYVTKNINLRTEKIIEIADAFVIFKGGTGTLSEMGQTWELAKFEYGNHEPLIFFGKFWKKIIEGVEEGLDLEKIERNVVEVVETPEEVLKLLGMVDELSVWEKIVLKLETIT